jgi:hypothetical protein
MIGNNAPVAIAWSIESNMHNRGITAARAILGDWREVKGLRLGTQDDGQIVPIP